MTRTGVLGFVCRIGSVRAQAPAVPVRRARKRMRTGSPQLLAQASDPGGARLAADGPSPAASGTALWRALARRVSGGRAAIGWARALLYVFKALVCFATFVFPISATQPTRLIAAAGALAILGAVGVWLLANRISLLGFE